MNKKVINTAHAPAPIGPYSQAVQYGDIIYISGQVCIDPATGNLNNATLEDETHQVMKNLQAILTEAGINFTHVIKTTIFLTDMHHFAEVNAVYGSYLDADGLAPGTYPARETVQVSALPKFVNVEIGMIAGL